MKDKRSNRYKTAAWILLIAGIVSFSVINIFSLFFHYSNRIHNEILNRNMEQISLLSDYIVKIIRSEMRHCTEILNIGEENFSVPEQGGICTDRHYGSGREYHRRYGKPLADR